MNLDEKLDKLADRVSDLAVIAAQNTKSLDEHMRRCDALEKRNDLLEAQMSLFKENLEKKITPIAAFVDRAKFLGAVLCVAGTFLVGLQKLGLLHSVLNIK